MTWWQYLLLVNVYLLLFYGFYTLLLCGETFFRLNRVYLVGSTVLSFVIPIIQTDWLRNLFITKRINQTIYQLDAVTITASPQHISTDINIGQMLGTIYLMGIIILLVRLVFQLLKLKKAFNNTATGDAYSFFSKVKINQLLLQEQVIAAHENVHARQWHSADVLLIELVAIINWFNPVVYLYRKAIKHIHEFIADNEIINKGTTRQVYAMILLSQTFNAPVSQLANSFFNHSLLKQRIMMLHKNPSQRKALLKYGLSAPLFALMVILSSATAKTTTAIAKINEKAAQVLQYKPVEINNKKDAASTFKKVSSTPVNEKSFAISSPQNRLKATTQKDTTKKGPLFISVQQSAQFPGGIEAFGAFLGKNIRYPAEAKKKNIQGRVICQFNVEQDGSLSDVKVIRSIGGGCDEEALRVIALSPKWTPGMQDGKVVRQQYTVPISFEIDGAPKAKPAEVILAPPPTVTPMLNQVTVVSYVDNNNTTNKKSWPKDVDYYINGKLTSLDSAKHIAPKDIYSIDVIKDKSTNGKGQIWIKTKN